MGGYPVPVRIALVLVLAVVACRAAPSAAPLVIGNRAPTPTCADAAAGLARGANDPGDPDVDLMPPLRARCEHDGWPSGARACFAAMRDTDLGRCAAELPGGQRAALFDVLSGGTGDRGQLALTRARLQATATGLASCDRYIAQVATTLGCEAMPLDQRLSLGQETATMWVVPLSRLPAKQRDQMSAACAASTENLQHQDQRAGCAP